MIIHTIINEHDVFRGNNHVPKRQKAEQRSPYARITTNPAQYLKHSTSRFKGIGRVPLDRKSHVD